MHLPLSSSRATRVQLHSLGPAVDAVVMDVTMDIQKQRSLLVPRKYMLTWQYPTSESRNEYPTSTLRRVAWPSSLFNQGWQGKVRGRSCRILLTIMLVQFLYFRFFFVELVSQQSKSKMVTIHKIRQHRLQYERTVFVSIKHLLNFENKIT